MRMDKETKERIEEAAKISNLPASTFSRMIVTKEAYKLLGGQNGN